MGCGCKNKDRYQVVVNGRIVFSTTTQGTADAVAKRYPGSEVVYVAATG